MMKIVFAALTAFALLSPQESKDFGKRPDWSIKLPDGKKASAADYDNKVVIVDFWATWCPPCRKEIPGFIKLQKEYGDKGLAIVGFSFDRDQAAHDKFVKDQGMNYLSIFVMNEAGQAVVESFQKLIGEIKGIPTTLVIDRKGQIVYKHVGYGSPEEFEKVIKPLL
jgi:thiol-disulfide isomerase/thioredoxin